MQERARETKCQLLKYFWRIFVTVPVTPVSVFQVVRVIFFLVGKKRGGWFLCRISKMDFVCFYVSSFKFRMGHK